MKASLAQDSYTSSALAAAIFAHASQVSRTTSVTDLIRLNADFARELTAAERCSLWLVDAQRGELWTILADGIDPIRIAIGQGLVGACVLEQQVILVNEPASDPRFLRHVDQMSGYITKQVLCIPMRCDGEIIGALQLLNKGGGFTVVDADLVSLSAHFAATAIQGERFRQEAETARMLRHELDLAREVQSRMLPQNNPTAEGLQVAAYCRPAHWVGGDYYDLLLLDETHFAFTLGDVSGKGIAAAVMMASIQTLLRSLLLHSKDPLAVIIGEVSRALYQSSTANRFSTLFCGILDVKTGSLQYVNAGQANPLLMRSNQVPEELPGGNLPLGLMSCCAYEMSTVVLHSGDALLIFSDGLQEVSNRSGEFWEESRIGDIFLAHAGAPVAVFPEVLAAEADAWAAGAQQHDDMTVVMLRLMDRNDS